MRHFFSVVQTPTGTAVSGATIDIYTSGSSTNHATIYSDDGITTTANPLTSASDGTFGFYAADGRYEIKVSGTGITTRTFNDVEIFDATEKNSGDGPLTANTASFTTLTVTGVATIGTSTTTGNATVGGTLQVTGATTLAAVAATTVNATTGVQINGAAAANTFLKGNGSNYIAGSPTLASADFANQGTTTTVLHGNGAGNPSFAVVTPSDATGNTTGSGNFVLTTTPTITTPVITGTPTGTGIPTLTLKKGSGAGNYTGTNTSYVDVDGTNLAYTVTIPTGWKLSVQVNAVVFITTATAAISLAILDTSVIHENQITAVLNSSIQSCLGWVITGDGASHTIKLQAKTGTGADAWNVFNDTATRCPTMTFNLSPSN